jgi:hypothetical protein
MPRHKANNQSLVFKKTLQQDKKLAYSSNEERELRLKFPFANVFIQFPTTGDSLSFPAYLKGLTDTFAPSFTPVTVFGRMDDIPVYQSTKRSLSFSLAMPAYNEPHAREILKNINTIVKNLYPSYVNTDSADTKILNSPPLIRIKFANLICDAANPARGLFGFLNGSIAITHGIESAGLFLIEHQGDGVIYAKTYEVSFPMTVLHEHSPGWDENGNFISGEEFPYALDSSSSNFFKEQSDGSPKAPAINADAARLPGSTNSGAGTEGNKAAEQIGSPNS